MINLLQLNILLPLLAITIICIFQKKLNEHPKLLYVFSLIFSLSALIIGLFIYKNFDFTNNQFQFAYTGRSNKVLLAADGLSLSFILLTNLLVFACIVISNNIKKQNSFYFICLFFTQFIVLTFFSTTNLLLFYIMFEMSLIPLYLMIGIWGGEKRIYAAFKFFLYTLAGSLLFLIAIIYLNNKFHTLDITSLIMLSKNGLTKGEQQYLWLAIFIAMAVKIPMLPVHSWLPDAHLQAPTAGSALLAGILLKLGGYGIIRILIPLLPQASVEFSSYVFALSIIAIIFTSMVAFVQTDMKKMIAYSSIAHMGYVTIGLFSNNSQAIDGAIFQMISHGIISAGLFIIVGCLYNRTHTKEISKYGNSVSRMPILALFFMILTMGSVGLPGTSGFIGEIMVVLGMFNISFIVGLLTATGVVVGAVYMLNLYKNIMFGQNGTVTSQLSELELNEKIILFIFSILTIVLGFYPQIIFEMIKHNAININLLNWR